MAKGQILVIDDEQAIRDLISEVLKIADYEVSIATDGLDGLNKIRKQKYDLIILDANI